MPTPLYSLQHCWNQSLRTAELSANHELGCPRPEGHFPLLQLPMRCLAGGKEIHLCLNEPLPNSLHHLWVESPFSVRQGLILATCSDRPASGEKI